jgi:GT2 family glycosyltransferase
VHKIESTHPKVTIVISNWNGKKDTVECLESIRKIGYPNYEVILIDNASTDGSSVFLRKKFPEIKLFDNKENLGFAGGNNVGIQYAMKKGTDYVLLLDNDTKVDQNFLTELVEVSQNNPRIGIVGPKIYFYHNPKQIVCIGANFNFWTGQSSLIGYKQFDNGQFDTIRYVDYVSGCALLIKRDTIKKIGILYARYHSYYEETEWCVRAREAGYKVCSVPKAKIWHKVSTTARKISGYSQYYKTRNRFWFMKRNSSSVQFISFVIYFFLKDFLMTSGSLIVIHKDSKLLQSFLKGIFDGLIGSMI